MLLTLYHLKKIILLTGSLAYNGHYMYSTGGHLYPHFPNSWLQQQLKMAFHWPSTVPALFTSLSPLSCTSCFCLVV